MLRPRLYHFILVILSFCYLNACGKSSPDESLPPFDQEFLENRTMIQGNWRLSYNSDCYESYNFSSGQDLIITSKAQYIGAMYQSYPSESGGRGTLDIDVIFESDTGCIKSAELDVAMNNFGIYYEFVGDSMLWYAVPFGGQLLASLDYIPQSKEVRETTGYELDIVHVSPSVLTIGEETPLEITVNYKIPDDSLGSTLLIGTNKNYAGLLIADKEFELTETTGEITAFITTRAFDWGTDNEFYLNVWIFDKKTEVPVSKYHLFEIKSLPF